MRGYEQALKRRISDAEDGLEDPVMNSILSGQIVSTDSIPKMRSFQIKVFVCCTPTDTREERYAVFSEIVPKLVAYAREKHGLEFHYLDLKLGVEGKMDDYTTREFYVKELLRCQNLSMGPNFVAFAGQKYGSRLPPSLVAADVFETIRRTLYEHRGRKARGAALLDKWYLKDTNSCPPIYVLQSAADDEQRGENDAVESMMGNAHASNEVSRMMQVLQYGVELCCKEGSLPPSAVRDYFVSDFENELKQGTLTRCDEDALVFIRTIEDLLNYLSESCSQTFTDVLWNDDTQKWEQHQECAALLKSLITHTIKQRLPERQIHEFSILWRYDSGVHPVLHRPYILDFCNSFHKNLLSMIDRAAAAHFSSKDDRTLLDEEVISHWRHAVSLGTRCYGRQSALAMSINYLLASEVGEPLVIHGDSGVGKTTLMAAIQLEIQKLPLGDSVLVARYCGLTAASADILRLLHSICVQLHRLTKRPSIDIPTDMSKLSKHFWELLQNFPKEKTLIVLLDGIDMLSSRDGAHMLKWVPPTLQRNVKMLLSTSTGKNDVLGRLTNEVLHKRDNFIELPPVGPNGCLELMSALLQKQNQKLSQPQQAVLLSAFRQCSVPLYARLLLNETAKWRSFDSLDDIYLPTTVNSYITWFMERLEEMHGAVIVSSSLSYLTASTFGLSDLEMEELLSLDDAVSASLETDSRSLPSMRRLPPYVWARLRDDLSLFLTLHEIDDLNVYSWFHECFADGARTRYLSDKAFARKIHSTMADYYYGHWHKLTKNISGLERNPGISAQMHTKMLSSYDLMQSGQATKLAANGTGSVKFSRRVYSQLPSHLYFAERLDELSSVVAFNYEWIYNKTKVVSLLSVLADVRLVGGAEARLLESALQTAAPVVANNVKGIAPELIGRLLPHCYQYENIRRLVTQCETVGAVQCSLIPAFGYPTIPGSPLKLTVDNDETVESMSLIHEGNCLLTKCPASPIIRQYEVTSGKLLRNITTSLGHMHVPPSGLHVAVVDGEVEKSVKVHDSRSGAFLGQFIPCNHCDIKIPSKCHFNSVSVTDHHVCLVVSDMESSHFCICDLPSCNFRKAVSLEGRQNLTCIASNGQYVLCSSGCSIQSYRLADSYEHVDTSLLDQRPTGLAISESSTTAFVSNDEVNVVTVLHLAVNGRTHMVTKVSLRDSLGVDSVRRLIAANTQNFLGILGSENVVVYSCLADKVLLCVRKPSSVPSEFRLPKQEFSSRITFTDARFTKDDQYILCSLFREVQVWNVKLAIQSQAIRVPIGIVQHVLHSSANDLILTACMQSRHIHVWDLNGSTAAQTTDRLTAPVKRLKLSQDCSMCFAACEGSDELGVFDMGSGQLRHLLTHESEVVDFVPSADGDHLLVSLAPSKAKHCNRIWYVKERRVLREFGTSPGAAAALTKQSAFIHFSPRSRDFKAPYSITQYDLSGADSRETEAPFSISFLIGNPFVTENDKYLVVLTAESYAEYEARYTKPSILAFTLRSGLSYKLFDENELEFMNANRIINEVRPVKNLSNQVIAIYTLIDEAVSRSEKARGFFLLDLHAGRVLRYSDTFASLSTDISAIHFSPGGHSFVNSRTGIVYSMSSGEPLASMSNDGNPTCLLCDGKSAAYRRGSEILVEHLKTNEVVARCQVESEIRCMEVGCDEQTLVLGGSDGTVMAYVLLDRDFCDVPATLSAVRNRRASSRWQSEESWGRLWDSSVPQGRRSEGSESAAATLVRSRSTSAANALPLDRDRLKTVDSVHSNRPRTSNGYASRDRAQLLSRAGSRACRLM